MRRKVSLVIVLSVLTVVFIAFKTKQTGTYKLSDKKFTVNSVYRFYPKYLFSCNPVDTDIIRNELDSIVDFMKLHSEIKFEVGYHTDHRGTETSTMILSLERAELIAEYLILFGVDSTNILVKGYGKTQPLNDYNKVYKNEKLTHREKEYLIFLNNRAELKILSINKNP